MKNRKKINYRLIQIVSVLAAFAFAQPAFALCIQSDPPADPVLAIDANNGCDDIQGQEGCNIKSVDGGTCTYPLSPGPGEDFFTVLTTLNPDGSLSWTLTDDSTIRGIDTAMVGGGAKGKNNCGYSFKYDVDHGSGGDCKVALDANGDCPGAFQNITSLDICTDGVDEAEPEPPVEPPAAVTLKSCQTQEQFLAGAAGADACVPGDGDPPAMFTNGLLDDTGIQCPKLRNEDGTFAVDGNGDYIQAPVIVCNLEKNKYAWGTVGANEEGAQEEVCCECGITMDITQTCFVSDDPEENAANGCADTLTSDPTQEVILQFQKDGTDPCEKIRSGGKVYKTCW